LYYIYGMRLRGFSISCQPMHDFVKRVDDASGTYRDLLVYSERLAHKELEDFELDFIGTEENLVWVSEHYYSTWKADQIENEILGY